MEEESAWLFHKHIWTCVEKIFLTHILGDTVETKNKSQHNRRYEYLIKGPENVFILVRK